VQINRWKAFSLLISANSTLKTYNGFWGLDSSIYWNLKETWGIEREAIQKKKANKPTVFQIREKSFDFDSPESWPNFVISQKPQEWNIRLHVIMNLRNQ
jgi:hypothetical protein